MDSHTWLQICSVITGSVAVTVGFILLVALLSEKKGN